MLSELTQSRCKALELLARHLRSPSQALSLDAIVSDISDEDLLWVTEKIHYYLIKLLEEVDYEVSGEECLKLTE